MVDFFLGSGGYRGYHTIWGRGNRTGNREHIYCCIPKTSFHFHVQYFWLRPLYYYFPSYCDKSREILEHRRQTSFIAELRVQSSCKTIGIAAITNHTGVYNLSNILQAVHALERHRCSMWVSKFFLWRLSYISWFMPRRA